MIEVADLSFTYAGSATPAIDNIDFGVGDGEIFGFLGPSGAGKSSTQKILIGLLRKDAVLQYGSGLYFVGAAVSPLRVGEYLGAKVVSLAILALGENTAAVLLFYGTGFNAVTLAVGLTLLCGFYTLAGFIAISRYDSINSFLIPSGLAITVLLMPPIVFHFRADPTGLIYLHPVQPFLSLVSGRVRPRPEVPARHGLARDRIARDDRHGDRVSAARRA